MPIDTLIAIIPVILLFAFFAATMIWADISSRKR
jgi:hypothetical protein